MRKLRNVIQFQTLILLIMCLAISAWASSSGNRCIDTTYVKLEYQGDLMNAMRMISSTTGMQVCGYFERADNQTQESLYLEHFTGRQAMETLVTIWPGYEWFEGPGNVVIVLPRGKIDDPEFFLNMIIEETRYDNAPISDALGLLIANVPGGIGKFHIGSGFSAHFEDPYRKSARFSATIPETTLLDHMSQVMTHFDGVASWLCTTHAVNDKFTETPLFVKTVDMQEADDYAISRDSDPKELLRKYDQAAASAPLEALRIAIGLKKAQVHMQHRPLGSNSLQEADSLSNQILESDDPVLIGIWPEAMNIHIDLCIQKNNTDAVYNQFLDLAQKNRQELYEIAVPAPFVMNCLHRLESHRRPGVDVTALLREQYGSNPAFSDFFDSTERNEGVF